MTVKELIAQLKELPEDTLVVSPGYEGGYHDHPGVTPKVATFAKNVHTEWYYGNHELVDYEPYADKERFQAIVC